MSGEGSGSPSCPPRSSHGDCRARGGTPGIGVTRAGRAPGWTHTRGGGGVQPRPHPPPPPSRGLADIFGDISRRLAAARVGSSAKGEGIPPPPQGGGREQGTSVDPLPHPSGGGDLRSTGGAGPPPPPPRGRAGATKAASPSLPPTKKGTAGGGGRNRVATAPYPVIYRPIPACKSCKGHRGVRHCCSRHQEGHPTVLGGGGSTVSASSGGGGGGATWHSALRSGACAGSLIRGRGRGSNRAGSSSAAAGGARRSRSAATGGPQRRAHKPRRTSFRRAATHILGSVEPPRTESCRAPPPPPWPGQAGASRHPPGANPWVRSAACEGQTHHCHTKCDPPPPTRAAERSAQRGDGDAGGAWNVTSGLQHVGGQRVCVRVCLTGAAGSGMTPGNPP